MIKYLKLQRRFDAAQVRAEVAALEKNLWKAHYNKAHYTGGWEVLPLRAINGNAENIVAVHAVAGTDREWADTPLLDACPYTREALAFFKCGLTAVRFMRLEAGAVIKEHCDAQMSFEEGEARLHIPVQTNGDVAFYVEDERVVMEEGSCWYLNLSLPHRVTNGGTEARTHLVIDCVVNDWLRNLFAEEAEHRKDAEPAAIKTDPEEQLKVIAELRRMNTATSLQLAAQMEKELSA